MKTRADATVHGPISEHQILPGLDAPSNGIVITWQEWGPMWRWETLSWTEASGYHKVYNDNGTIAEERYTDEASL